MLIGFKKIPIFGLKLIKFLNYFAANLNKTIIKIIKIKK